MAHNKLALLQVEIQYLGLVLNALKRWVNNFVYACPGDSLSLLKSYELRYHDLHNLLKSSATSLNSLYKYKPRPYVDLHDTLENIFDYYQKSLRPSCTLENHIRALEKCYLYVMNFQISAKVLLDKIEQERNQGYLTKPLDVIKHAESDFREWFFKQSNWLVDEPINDKNVMLQIEINKLQNKLKESYQRDGQTLPALLHRKSSKQKPQTLGFRQSYDILLLRRLYDADWVKKGLENKLDLLQFRYQQEVKLIQRLRSKLSDNWFEPIRLQKTIYVYKQWLDILKKYYSVVENNCSNQFAWYSRLNRQYMLPRLLSEGKAGVLNEQLQKVSATLILQQLKVMSCNDSALLQTLEHEKLQIKNLCQKIEDKLLRIVSQFADGQPIGLAERSTIKVLSYLGHLVSSIPLYQQAIILTEINNLTQNQLSHIPIVGEELPEEMLTNIVKPSVGIVYTFGALWALSSMNYFSPYVSYLMITAFNRVLLSHVDSIIKVGGYVESFSQRLIMPAFNYIKSFCPNPIADAVSKLQHYLRFDDLGMLDKLDVMSWLLGLSTHLVVDYGVHPVSVSMAYILATGMGKLTSVGIESLAADRIDASKRKHVTILVHFLMYSTSYRYGFQLGQWLENNAEPFCANGLTEAEALHRLGIFHQPATPAEIKTAFRQASLEFHPDKQLNVDVELAHEQFNQIRSAYECLAKR